MSAFAHRASTNFRAAWRFGDIVFALLAFAFALTLLCGLAEFGSFASTHRCASSHTEEQTTWMQIGDVWLPFSSSTSVCNAWVER